MRVPAHGECGLLFSYATHPPTPPPPQALDMPSAYMSLVSSVNEIRDVPLSASLARARLREAPGGLSVVSFPSTAPLADACDVAAQRSFQLLLAPAAFVLPRGGEARGRPRGATQQGAGGGEEPPEELESEAAVGGVLRALRAAPRACAAGLLFDAPGGLLFGAGRILAPVPEGSRLAEPALALLAQLAPEAEISLLRVGAPAPGLAQDVQGATAEAPGAGAGAGAGAGGEPARRPRHPRQPFASMHFYAGQLAGLAGAGSARARRGTGDASESAAGEEDTEADASEGEGEGEGAEGEGEGELSEAISRQSSSGGSSALGGGGGRSGRSPRSPALSHAEAGARAPPEEASPQRSHLRAPLPPIAEALEAPTLNAASGAEMAAQLAAARRDAEAETAAAASETAVAAAAAAAAAASSSATAAASPPAEAPSCPPAEASSAPAAASSPAIPAILRRRPNLREIFPSSPELLGALARALGGGPGAGAYEGYTLLVLGAQPEDPGPAAQEAAARTIAGVLALAAARRVAVLLVIPPAGEPSAAAPLARTAALSLRALQQHPAPLTEVIVPE